MPQGRALASLGHPRRDRASGAPTVWYPSSVPNSEPASRVLAIIPALNESASIDMVVRSLTSTLPHVDVLVIDDGSSDDTADVARAAGAMVATLPFNLGIGAALRVGFRFARDGGYGQAFQFDADGQHLAEEVPKLLAPLADRVDMVVGTRFRDGASEYQVGATRGLAMGILRAVIGSLAGERFTDTSSGFRGFGPRAIEAFAATYPRDYMDSVEALIAAVYRGFTIREVPVRMQERVAGVPSNRRFRLAYHYLRLLSVLVLTASRSGRRSEPVRS